MAQIPENLLFDVVIEQPQLTQAKMGGVTDDGYETVGIYPMAIQSASPREMENWKRRGVDISHKLYTTEDVSSLKQGMRATDPRYTPVRYYILQCPPEDMGGAGEIYGIFANLSQ